MTGPRIISMVPSLTETLISIGANVVGRTRYCIHPGEIIPQIPIVGGTKDIRWAEVEKLGADFLLLDREENPKTMADHSRIPLATTHITSIHAAGAEFEKLGHTLQLPMLQKIADRYVSVCERSFDPGSYPGVKQWIKKPSEPLKRVVYFIWKDPWMVVSKDTFIGSVLQWLGFEVVSGGSGKYPQINMDILNPETDLLLFSSEPYNFKKAAETLSELPFHSALVDGEVFSWFGVRNLIFMESLLKR